MTNEEMQRTMQFIVEQQAQFAANLQKLEEAQLRSEDRFIRLEESVSKLGESQESLHGLVGAIAIAQATTEVNLQETDRRLNNLITVFERYLGEHRNGNSEST